MANIGIINILLWEQRVAGSNPASPTLKMKDLHESVGLFCCSGVNTV